MQLASWALLTLQDAKEHLDIHDDDHDLEIGRMVESATRRCESICDTGLLSRQYVEVYDGTGRLDLRLRNFPVTAVSQIRFLTSWAPDAWTVQNLSTYPIHIVQPTAETIRFRNLFFPYWEQSVEVTYTAGVVAATTADIPAELRDACLVVLTGLWKQKDKQMTGIATQSAFGQTVTYDLDQKTLKTADDLLTEYKRWRP